MDNPAVPMVSGFLFIVLLFILMISLLISGHDTEKLLYSQECNQLGGMVKEYKDYTFCTDEDGHLISTP